jgi:hypothetical protein
MMDKLRIVSLLARLQGIATFLLLLSLPITQHSANMQVIAAQRTGLVSSTKVREPASLFQSPRSRCGCGQRRNPTPCARQPFTSSRPAPACSASPPPPAAR